MTDVLFDRTIVEDRIPHRPPFLLVDDIIAFEKDVTCTARRHVDPADPVFGGHFPGNPVYPGVLILEHMAQAACFLMNHSSDGAPDGSIPVLGKADKVRWSAMVKPGDTLVSTVTMERQVAAFSILAAECKVNDKRVAKCELVVKLVAS